MLRRKLSVYNSSSIYELQRDIGSSGFEILNSSRKLIPKGELFSFVVVVVVALSSCALADFSQT